MEYALKINRWLILASPLAIGVVLILSGCEGTQENASFPASNVAAPTPTTPVVTNSANTNAISDVLNDDPHCELVLKYQSRNIENDGQVHYVNRYVVSDPFGSANPICVQYNDTRSGEVTVWKEPNSRGQRIDKLPSDRDINKIVVWFK